MAEEQASQESGAEAPSTAENLYGQSEGTEEQGNEQSAEQSEAGTENQSAEEQSEASQEETQGQEQPAQEQESPAEATFEGLESREGDVELSQQDFDQLKKTLEDAGVSLDQQTAQNLVNFEQDRIRAMQQAQQEAHQNQINDWIEQTKKDRELGGEKFNENLTAAQEALGELATPELREVLEQTGLGSHPEMVRLFHKLAPLVREENPASPSGHPSSGEQSRLERLYGKQAS